MKEPSGFTIRYFYVFNTGDYLLQNLAVK